MKKVHSTLVAVSISLAMALTLPSCSGSGGGGDGGDSSSSGGNSLLLNFTSNMDDDGQLRWMNTTGTALVMDSLSFDQDSRVFTYDGKIFVLERPLDPTTWVSDGALKCLYPPSGNSSSSKPAQYGSVPLAAGSNPYEIAFIGRKGYIAQYGVNYIQVFDVDKCKLENKIALPNVIGGPLFGSGSSQNTASIKTDGTKLFIVMQRWNPYPSNAEKGVLIRLNTDGTPTNPPDTVQLKYYNPQSSVLKGQKLYIASAYNLSSPPGIDTTKSGIEYLNGLTANSTTNLISGDSLGGRGPTSMVLGDDELWVIAYKDWLSGQDLNAKVMSVSFSGSVDSARVPSVTKATCLVYDSVSTDIFIGNGNAFSSPPASLIKYSTIYNGTTIIVNSVWQTDAYALPPYSLAIVRYNDPD